MTISFKLITVFILLFLDFGIAFGTFKLPFFSSILVIFVTGTSIKSFKRALIGGAMLFIFGCLGYFTSQSGAPWLKVLSSITQSTIALLIFFSLLEYATSLRNHYAIEKAANSLLIFMLIMLFLERLGITESFSLEFARIVYTDETGFKTYESIFSVERDISLAGFRRPTLFSPEPSIAAIGLGLTLIIKSLFGSSFRTTIINISLAILIWFLIKSPIILLALLVIISKNLLNLKKLSTQLIYLPAAIIFFFILISLISTRYLGMTANQFSIEETSEGLRLILPYLVLFESWFNLHIFGTGPGAIYSEDFMIRLNPYGVPVFGTNALALFFFYFGPFIGLFLFASFIRIVFKFKSLLEIDRASVYSIFVLFFLANTLGAFEPPRLLGLFGVFLIFLKSAKKLGRI